MVEKMSENTIEGAVSLHIECFKDSFLSSLDRDVLSRMYENYVFSELGCAYVYIENGQVVGLIAGSVNPSLYYSQLLKKQWIQFLWLTLKRVARDPRVLLSIARRNFSGFFRPDESEKAYLRANLETIGVKEEYRGKGVAEHLAKAFLNELRGRGVLEVLLGVSPANTRAIRFYEKIGMRHLRTDRRPDGEEVRIYGMRLDGGE